MRGLIKKIRIWGSEKGFIKYENRFQQLCKLSEEVGELSSAILKDNRPEQLDAIGDIQVVLILLCEMLGLDYKTCLEMAYCEIKNRTGKVKDGCFIKDEEKQFSVEQKEMLKQVSTFCRENKKEGFSDDINVLLEVMV